MAKRKGQNPGEPEQTIEESPELEMPAFPDIGEETPEAEAEGEGKSPLDERLEALERRLDEERRSFDSERNQWQQTIDRLIQTQTAPKQEQAAPEPQQPVVDFSNLPDPVDKFDDFKRQLSHRMNDAIQKGVQSQLQNFQSQQASTQSFNATLDNVWNKFQQTYPDLADKSITLQGAVAMEKNELQQRGVDIQQGIMSDPDGFMRRVADRMRGELGMAQEGQQASPQGGSGRGQPQTLGQSANRTGGLAGGSNVNGGRGKQKADPPGFLAQLKKAQMDSGLI